MDEPRPTGGEELLREVLLGPGRPLPEEPAPGHLSTECIEAAAEGALLPYEAPAVEAHLRRCRACAGRVASRRALLSRRRPRARLFRLPVLAAAAALVLLALTAFLARDLLRPGPDREARRLLALIETSGPGAARRGIEEFAARFPTHEVSRYAGSGPAPVVRAPPAATGAIDLLEPRFDLLDGPTRFAWWDRGTGEPARAYHLQVRERGAPDLVLLDRRVVGEGGGPQSFEPAAGDWRERPGAGVWFEWTLEAPGDRRAAGLFRILDPARREAVQAELRRIDGLAGRGTAAAQVLRAWWFTGQALRNSALFAEALSEWEALARRFPSDPEPSRHREALHRALGLPRLAEEVREGAPR